MTDRLTVAHPAGDDVNECAPRGAARDRGDARHVSARDELPYHVRFDSRATGVDSRILDYGGRRQGWLWVRCRGRPLASEADPVRVFCAAPASEAHFRLLHCAAHE